MLFLCPKWPSIEELLRIYKGFNGMEHDLGVIDPEKYRL